jgi:ABC-2 type transport system permease protein
MTKLLIVAQQEVVYQLRQWSFYVSLLLMPLLFAAIGAMPRLQQAAQAAPLPKVETVFNLASTEFEAPVGYVDKAGLLGGADEVEIKNLVSFAGETEATEALAQGKIESYYVIAADYIQTGRIVQYSADPQLLAETDVALSELLRRRLISLLEAPALAKRLEAPVKWVRQGPPPQAIRFLPTDLNMKELVSAGLVVGLFVYLINVGGNLLLRALQQEVRAKALEVMVVSTTSEQFIGGKLLGLSALTLAQAGLALGAGALVYGGNPDGSGPAALSLSTLVLSGPYLVLGFLAYGGGVMGMAALWPNFRESAILLACLRLLSLTPLIGGLFILPDIDGPLAVGLTLAPVTSHLLMPFRLLLAEPPLWQWAVGLLILLGWTVFWMWLSTRLFRLHGLLTSRPASPRLVWQALWN